MSSDAKSTAPVAVAQTRHKGMKIFTYPKIIFIWPTMATAIICAIGMVMIGNDTTDPTKEPVKVGETKTVQVKTEIKTDAKGNVTTTTTTPIRRFSSVQNVLGMFFIVVFFFNLLIMAIDFPRFTIIALVLLAAAMTFFLLWLNVWFNVIPGVVALLERVFAVANATFYMLIALAIAVNFGIIWVSRYLDYWEILPNEILHNHGPFSDLERFPTTNLKFDKEIPDILEYALLRSGRLVLHVQNERKAIVLDNVLWIDHKEAELKKLMSRMEVRITTDQEAAAESS